MGVDEVDQRLQITPRRVVGCVVLEFAPVSEEGQLRVVGTPAFFEVPGCQGKGLQTLSSSGQSYSTAGGHECHHLRHSADVGAAQNGIGLGDGPEFCGDVGGAGKAKRNTGEVEPAVGLCGKVGAETEGLRQGQAGAVEAGHDVLGSAPVVDGLCRVTDHDELGVAALGQEDVFDDRIGVLCLVQQEKVGVEPRPGECPDFQVVVVVETDGAAVGVLQVGPGFAGERHDVVGKFSMAAGVRRYRWPTAA